MPTRYGSRLHEHDGVAPDDAAVVSILRSSGAIILGKTATTEFAATSQGGPCANPLDLRRTPGGSSSGSAAAVADFHCPISLGTQTGGSMIRPASFTGIFGMKVSYHKADPLTWFVTQETLLSIPIANLGCALYRGRGQIFHHL